MYATRASQMDTTRMDEVAPHYVTRTQFFFLSQSFRRGDWETYLAEVDRIARTVDVLTDDERSAIHFACLAYLGLGRLRAAQEMAEKIIP
jgi:hypothetical protein